MPGDRKIVFPVLPDEAGQFAAARMRADQTGAVTSIRYLLLLSTEQTQCEVDLAHEVWVFKGGASPDETLSAAGRYAILVFAFLGWMFAGFHLAISSIVMRPAVKDLLPHDVIDKARVQPRV